MKVEELRIGNWVIDLDGSEYKIATGNDIDGMWEEVLITEQRLLDYGFKRFQIYEQVYEFIKEFRPLHKFTIQSDGDIFIVMGYYDGVEIKYIHQLQNLYFALTGTELELKSLPENVHI